VILNKLLCHLRNKVARFKELNFYHILRSLNKDVDLEANSAVHLGLGELMVNLGPTRWAPPLKYVSHGDNPFCFNKHMFISSVGKVDSLKSIK